MGVTFSRSKTKLNCPICNSGLIATRCRIDRDTTYSIVCETCVYPSVQTGWYYTKDDAIQAAKDGFWRGDKIGK